MKNITLKAFRSIEKKLFCCVRFNEQMQNKGAASDTNWFYQTVRVFFE